MTLITEKFQKQDQDSWQEAQQCEGPAHLELWRELNLPGNYLTLILVQMKMSYQLIRLRAVTLTPTYTRSRYSKKCSLIVKSIILLHNGTFSFRNFLLYQQKLKNRLQWRIIRFLTPSTKLNWDTKYLSNALYINETRGTLPVTSLLIVIWIWDKQKPDVQRFI